MYCRNCGRLSSAADAVCAGCGSRLPAPCPRCGAPNDPEAQFCAGCGAARAAPTVERKFVTVLFADIAGATAMIAGADPEDADRTFQPAITAMRDAVRRYEGTVNRVAGDGIMALFGAPRALEDHAVRACYAALAMSEDVSRRTGGSVRIRVGLHSGAVLVRGVANDFATDYDAIGETSHVANRMEALAAANTVCITAETYRLAEGYVTARSRGRVAVRGLPAPIEVFELLGRSALADTWGVREARGLTELVGRDEEIALLLRTLDDAASGHGRVVRVVGEAGIGKSRLTREIGALARRRGWQVVIERGLAEDQATSHRPLGRLLRAWIGIGDRQGHGEVRERLQAFVQSLAAAELGPHVAGLQSLLDLPVEDASWRQLDPRQRRARIVDALVAVALCAARAAPTLLAMEDLHSADDETLAALAMLAARIGDAAVVLLVTHRPEMHGSWEVPDAIGVPLRPMGAEHGRRMLDALLGCAPSLEAVKDFLCERAGGNPLFLEESVRDLIDAGTLTRMNGAFGFDGQIRTVRIPGSITAVIGQRIDRLDPPLKSRLQTAAVVGRQFSLAILAELREEERDVLAQSLERLALGGFIYREPDAREPLYTFKHALTREVAYEGLLRTTRRRLHARIVGVIERIYEDRLAEYVDVLAEHAFAGRLWNQAARYRLSACKSAIERSASREAVALFDRALEMFDQMPEERDNLKAAIDLRAVVLNALLPLGDHPRLVRNLREAETLAESIGDDRRLGVVQSNLAMGLWLSGENDQALAMARKAAALAERLGNEALGLGARFNIGIILHAQGHYAEAIDVHTELLPHLTGRRERERMNWGGYPGVFVRTYLAQSCLELGRSAAAAEYVEYASALADQFDHPYSQAMIRSVAGQLLLAQDRGAQAIDLLAATVALCREHEIFTMWPLIAARLAVAYLRGGEVQRARDVLEPVLSPEVYQRSGVYIWSDLFLAAAETHLAGADAGEAARVATQAESLCRFNGALGQLAHALALLARIDEAQHRGDPALRRSEALALARRLGMRPLEEALMASGAPLAAQSSQR